MKSTFAAIASGLTNSGISIIRMCGNESVDIIDKIFVSKKGRKMCDAKTHTITYGHIYDDGELIDEVLVMYMKGPKSYTGEDTIEVNCHGGVFVTRKILDLIFRSGARPAEPGEFTKTAFLNGKIDLSRAEAVMDIINAKNEFSLKASARQLNGKLYEKIVEIRKKIIYEIAFIESALDDPEHYSTDGYSERLKPLVVNLLNEIKDLLNASDNGIILKEGINTVIIGKPNAGKSSLLNILTGEERAIVTDVEGTTRDILEENILLNGISLNIIDTAGIRHTEDTVEKIGVERAMNFAKDADLVLYVVDASTPLDERDEKIISLLEDRRVIILLNKSDLETVITEEIMRKKMDRKIISVSAKENEGINELADEISRLFLHGKIEFNDEVYITASRHLNELRNTEKSFQMVIKSIEEGMPEDFYSIDLMNAYTHLGKIIGESVEEDLVNEIFEKFCMGK